MRAFIALPVSPEIRKGLHSVMQRLRNTFRVAPIKWATPDQFHLTLRFLGNVPDESAAEITSRLRVVCGRFRPIDAFVSGLGCFPTANEPRVIWVGMNGGPGLLELQRAIAATTSDLGDRPTHESFHPHLTLGRVRDISTSERWEIGEALQRQSPVGEAAIPFRVFRSFRVFRDSNSDEHRSTSARGFAPNPRSFPSALA